MNDLDDEVSSYDNLDWINILSKKQILKEIQIKSENKDYERAIEILEVLYDKKNTKFQDEIFHGDITLLLADNYLKLLEIEFFKGSCFDNPIYTKITSLLEDLSLNHNGKYLSKVKEMKDSLDKLMSY